MTPVADLRSEFVDPSGYLSTATRGLIPAGAREAVHEAIDGRPPPEDPDGGTPISRSIALFAEMLGVRSDHLAIGSQTSVTSSLVAGNVRHLGAGDEVLCVYGDFGSVVFPFGDSATSSDYRVRHVPLAALADEISDRTAVVAFSYVQSADGALAAWDDILQAAREHDTWTYADLTQAAGWVPFGGAGHPRPGDADVTVTAAYKWLWTPRGVTLSSFSDRAIERLRPVHTSWHSGVDLDMSGYGPTVQLAPDARRFDVSPAWPQYNAMEHSLRLLGSVDPQALYDWSVGLADRFRQELGLEPAGSAIVSIADPDGAIYAAGQAAGLTLASRQGGARFAFHAYNTLEDVDRSVAAVRAAG